MISGGGNFAAAFFCPNIIAFSGKLLYNNSLDDYK